MGDRAATESRGEILKEVLAWARRSASESALPAVDLPRYLGDYYDQVSTEDLREHGPDVLAAAALTHLRLATERDRPRAQVRVFTPEQETDGWTVGHTVIQIVIDDMPFLVDSLTAALTRVNRRVIRVVHPVLRVARTADSFVVHPTAEPAIRPTAESWIHLEIPRETDSAELAEIDGMLCTVLDDVAVTVADYLAMRDRALQASVRLQQTATGLGEGDAREASALLRWLAEDHFTFVGYREHSRDTRGEPVWRARRESGLGILRPNRRPGRSAPTDPDEADQVTPLAEGATELERADGTFDSTGLDGNGYTGLVLAKSTSRSPVHRDAYLDYVAVPVFDAAGALVAEQRFIGLLAFSAYHESVESIPVLRKKAAAVLSASGYDPRSHSGADLRRVLETFPRDELFQITQAQLIEIALALVGAQNQRRVRLFVRRDRWGRFLSCLVYLPQEQYDTKVRLRVQHILSRATGAEDIDYAAHVGESAMAQLHVVIRMPTGETLPDLDLVELQQELAEAVRSWDDDLAEALVTVFGEESGAYVGRRYAHGFTDGYRETFDAAVAAHDIAQFERLPANGLSCLLYDVPGAATRHRFKIYRNGDAMSLSDILPILHDLGVTVTDEVPFDVTRSDGTRAHIYDFGLRAIGSLGPTERTRFQEAFEAVWLGEVESDGLNALVLAGLHHRTVSLLRSYAHYLKQIGAAFSQEYLQEAMTANPEVVRLMVALFRARFEPRLGEAPASRSEREAASQDIATQLDAALDAVPNLDHDRILRSVRRLVLATVRTNYYQPRADGTMRPYISLKIESRTLADLPEPRPWAEIWVSSPSMAGVHLRMGAVARGGLRWSDRREDFRTEVADLLKAQAVKNAVIVPVGAKGGFVVKRAAPAVAGQQSRLEAGLAAYRTFIRGLLDITDSRVPGTDDVRYPDNVVRWDDFDPYLVVAADKGTATFSDEANKVAAEHSFWLGDAFASGGSAGYDHKRMAITARGAWESVRRHFRDMGKDCQREPFTCVGIGDMSGDVFGNAMLLSPQTRLVAAFDHRHVFLDPDPDPTTSLAERKRLFTLPGSSWADYDRDLISGGGGVWSRREKSIPIGAEARDALGLASDVVELPPDALIRAVLSAPVDLLFNGGVGTFVKASHERHIDVGDKSNDRIRVDGCDLRCAIVVEGGNLGLTQRGRIEYALLGGRINNDAIDNSAGVDMSDHEVNIKILLGAAMREGRLTSEVRDEVLDGMASTVADLVLRHNYRQNVALTVALAQASEIVHVHDDYLEMLAAVGAVDREIAALPTSKEIRERRLAGVGLTSPELSVLLAVTKNRLFDQVLDSDLPDHPWLAAVLFEYFPDRLRYDFADHIERHPLRREIISTQLANRLVDTAGTTYLHRLHSETRAGVTDLVGAHTVAWHLFDVDDLAGRIDRLDGSVPAETQTAMRIRVRTAVERAARWFVLEGSWRAALDGEIDFLTEAARTVSEALPTLLPQAALNQLESRLEAWESTGVDTELARTVATLPIAHASLGIASIAKRFHEDLISVARVHFDVADRIGLSELHDRVGGLPRKDRWQAMARAAVRDELHQLQQQLTSEVVAHTPSDAEPGDRVDEWQRVHKSRVAADIRLVQEVLEEEALDLERALVGLRSLRDLLSRASAPGDRRADALPRMKA